MYPSLTTNAAADASQAATGIGGVLSAIGSVEAGSANASAAKYQGQIALNNAATATRNAEWTEQAGNIEAENQGLRNRAQQGSIVANQSANGLDVNSGSNKQVQASAREIGNMDALTIRSNAARAAFGYQTQARNFGAESGLKASEATNDLKGGYLGAGSSLLTTASQLGKQYSAWQNASGNGNDDKSLVPATLAGT